MVRLAFTCDLLRNVYQDAEKVRQQRSRKTLPPHVSAAFTNVTRVIPRVVNLSGSPYGHGTRACLGRLGVGGYECTIHPFACCGLAGRPFCASCGFLSNRHGAWVDR